MSVQYMMQYNSIKREYVLFLNKKPGIVFMLSLDADIESNEKMITARNVDK